MNEHGTKTVEIASQADLALRMVRLVLGVLSVFVVGAYRPLTGSPSWVSLTTTSVVIIAVVFGLNSIAKRLPPRRSWLAVAQALDVAAIVALAVILDDPLGQQSWVLLVIPVVSAAVRHGTIASVLSWVGGCLGYVTAVLLGAVDSTDGVTLFARVPGALLAVAIAVGMLARWMREGWELQNELTAAVSTRERRLAVIEQTRHILTNLAPNDALEICANQTVALGFAAATIDHLTQNQPPYAVGRSDIIAKSAPPQQQSPSSPLVTVWTDGEQVRVHSVAVHEPHANAIVTGWSETPIDHDYAQALATLVAHTSTAIETTTLLHQLRRAADSDALTGLANRRSLDHQLAEHAKYPGRLAVAFVDLDDFKHINDHHGHHIGDKALVALARRLESVAGSRGLVARYGGDEFVALLPGCSLHDAQRFAEAVIRATADPIALGPAQLGLRLSIGVATAQTPATPSDLIQAADNALYQAKAAGKATYVAVDLDVKPLQPPNTDSTDQGRPAAPHRPERV